MYLFCEIKKPTALNGGGFLLWRKYKLLDDGQRLQVGDAQLFVEHLHKVCQMQVSVFVLMCRVESPRRRKHPVKILDCRKVQRSGVRVAALLGQVPDNVGEKPRPQFPQTVVRGTHYHSSSSFRGVYSHRNPQAAV